MNYLSAYKAPDKTLFCPFYVSFCTFCASLRLTITVSIRPIRSLPTYQVGSCNPWLINDLRLYKALYNCRETFTDVMSALQIKLFMQNKAKFQKVKFNVTKVLTKDYDQMDTWSIRTKQSQTKPNKAKSKKAKMNVTSALTEGYENKPPIRAPKKQSQTSKRQKTMQTLLPQRIMKKTTISGPNKTNPNKANTNSQTRPWRANTKSQTRLGGPISKVGYAFLDSTVAIFAGFCYALCRYDLAFRKGGYVNYET